MPDLKIPSMQGIEWTPTGAGNGSQNSKPQATWELLCPGKIVEEPLIPQHSGKLHTFQTLKRLL